MKLLFGITFILWAVFMTIAQSAKVFKKYGLYENNLDKYRLGFTASEVKFWIQRIDNEEAKKELRRSLFFIRVSRFFLVLSMVIFIIMIIINRST